MVFRIEHALVMDTDHLPGGGGYAAAGMSPGVREAERVFVSENFGISDFLHDPENARVYFSVFRVPGGRVAFVRRFANGTRRGGAQNRMFVHTLFLDDDLLASLSYLPWLLYDRPLRLGPDEVYLTNDVEPLLREPAFPALEWSGHVSDAEAFDHLQLRYQQFGKRLALSGQYAGLDGLEAVAAVIDTLRLGRRAVIPQGALFEQLSLLVWSMLPPPDRLALPWTQHDGRNTSTPFGIVNAEAGDDRFVDLRARAPEVARRLVTINMRSVDSWADLHTTTARLGISLRSGDLEWWLRWRDSLENLLDNPLASDEELIPKLERVAKSVRADRREPWVDEREVLRFLETVPILTIGRLIERLAGDGSKLVDALIEATIRRPGALRELAQVLPPRKRELGRTIIYIIVSAVRAGDKDAGWFAEHMLLPQCEMNKDLPQLVSREDADALGLALRVRHEAYARVAATMRPEIARAMVSQVEAWLASEPRATLPLVRQILELVNRRDFPKVAVEALAFAAAEAGEPTRLWLPAAIDLAQELDSGHSIAGTRAFSMRVRALAERTKRLDMDAVRQVAAALRQLAGERHRAGVCMRELVTFTRPSWPAALPALSGALEAAIAAGSARASEWSSVVTDLVEMQSRGEVPYDAALTLIRAFWERLASVDFGVVPESLIDAVALVDAETANRLVTRWLLSVRALPVLATAERFLDALGMIASDEQYAELEVERSWREIERGVTDAGTFCRLESALSVTLKKTDADVSAAISGSLQGLSAAERPAWLVRLAAASETQPATRRTIETRFLPGALQRLGANWDDFLAQAGDDLFVHGNVLLTVVHELALSSPSPTVRAEFERACLAHDRDDAIEGLVAAVPRGLVEQASVWLSGGSGS